jgi:hypothetical protein
MNKEIEQTKEERKKKLRLYERKTKEQKKNQVVQYMNKEPEQVKQI